MSKEYPWGKGTPKWTLDAAANDSDKSFTVPTGKVWSLCSVQFTIATTATVGNRTMRCVISNGVNAVRTLPLMEFVAASGSTTGAWVFGAPGDPASGIQQRLDTLASSGTANWNRAGGPCILPAGYVVRVYDLSAIDAAADDLTVVLHYVEYDA